MMMSNWNGTILGPPHVSQPRFDYTAHRVPSIANTILY